MLPVKTGRGYIKHQHSAANELEFLREVMFISLFFATESLEAIGASFFAVCNINYTNFNCHLGSEF